MIPILDFGNGFTINLADPPWDTQGCRWAIAAISGGGKSTLARVMLEELYRIGQPFLVIDPKPRGEYRSLSELPGVLVAGEEGHIKVNYPLSGWVDTVINFVMKGAGVICHLGHLPESDQRVAYTWLVNRLWICQAAIPMEKCVPLFLVIDEADIFAPQKFQQDLQSLLVTRQLAKRGRDLGLNMIMMTQRPGETEKDIWSMFNMQLVGYIQYENDFRAVESLLNIGQQNGVKGKPPYLPPGMAAQPARVTERIEHRHLLGLATGEFYAVFGGKVFKLPPCREPRTADLARTPAIRARQRPLFELEEVGRPGAAYED